MEILKEDRNA